MNPGGRPGRAPAPGPGERRGRARARGSGGGRRAVVVRRRRLGAGVLAVVVVAAIVVAVSAVSAGSGGSGPKYVPPGGSAAASVLAPSPPTPGRRAAVRATPFRPSPAASALAGKLTLARQVAQLFMVSLEGKGPGVAGGLGAVDWGGVVLDSSNFAGDTQVRTLAGAVRQAESGAGEVPPLLAATQEGGPDTAFRDLPPQPEPVTGSGGQPQAAQAQALLAGRRLRSLGFNMTLAPLADVDTPGGPLSGRLFSTDPSAVAQFSSFAVAGYADAGIISAAGHFPGSGGASADPDQMTATVGGSLDQLRSRDLIPFAAITPKVPVIVMSNASYVAFDGVTPAGLLSSAVSLLRGEFGFQGVVMSDDLDATLQPTGADPGTVAAQAVQAGDDLLYITGPVSEQQQAYQGVLAAAQRSAKLRGLVYEALLRVLTLKLRYGVVR